MGKNAGWILAVASSMAFALLFWITSIDQPLIDHHDFRQTQTALTSFYIDQSMLGLVHYETPVLGFPWAIPFEFPLYQWVTNHWHKLTSQDLTTSGRIISVLFSAGCAALAALWMRHFKIGSKGVYCFLLLYFSSSIYLYWSRSFMIESTALFLSLVAALSYFKLNDNWDSLSNLKRYAFYVCLTASLSLALITKATTALPMLLLFGIIIAKDFVTSIKLTDSRSVNWRKFCIILTALIISFGVLKSWTLHADSIKSLNPIGIKLTSDALSRWNFGTLQQRWSSDLWVGTVLNRLITPLGTASLILIGLAFRYGTKDSQARNLVIVSLFLFISPLLLFPNLHIAHTYYQYSNHIFLLITIATSFELVIGSGSRLGRDFCLASITLFIIGSYGDFKNNNFDMAFRQSSDKLKIGKLIKRHTSPDDRIIVFGDDWSSALAFHSERKSLTLPKWPSLGIAPNRVLQEHSDFLGGKNLGAIVATKPILERIDQEKINTACKNPKLKTVKDYWYIYLCKQPRT